VKAIILAGGMGTRLGKYTKDVPKCMLKFLSKSLIERQVETIRGCGITEIIITRKHLKEKINIPGVEYNDKELDDTNMLDDFYNSIKDLDDDVVLCYGDIIYEPRVLKQAIESQGEVNIVADMDYKEYWTARLGDFRNDLESFVSGKNNKMISLGKANPKDEEIKERYVGIIKFSRKILPKIKEIYEKNKKLFWDKPWHSSPSFKKAYMTDFLQELINLGFDVRAVKIKKGWMEFDTVEDYENAIRWAKEKTLSRFINIT